MRLNNYSYVHKHIRLLCLLLEKETGLKLTTNLGGDISALRFESELSYIILDFRNMRAFILCVNLDRKQRQIIEELMAYCSWLEMGEKYSTKNLKNF